MAQFGIQGCLATQEAEEEPAPDVVMIDDEVATLKAQLAALQQQMSERLEAAENKIDKNAERIAKNTEIATIADARSKVNRELLTTPPVKTEEPENSMSEPVSQTVKKKVSVPVLGFLFDLTLKTVTAWKTAEKSLT